MKVVVNVDAWSRETYRSPEAYGDWSAEGGINGVSVRRSQMSDYRVVDLPEAKVGDYVFPVVAHYGTGDSFGHQSGGDYQVIGVYTTVEKADEVKALCELYTNDKIAYDEFVREQQGLTKRSINERVDQGLVIDGVDLYPYWTGYFESLNEIKVWLCQIEP